jgi:Flp pilus assembly protein TadB
MKPKFYYFVFALMFAVSAITANAASGNKAIRDTISGMTDAQKEERVQQIKQRIEEIRAMDKSQLSKIERKDLRNELKDIKKEAKKIKVSIYIAVSGLVILILLLIILL